MEDGAIQCVHAGIFGGGGKGSWKLYPKGFRANMGGVKGEVVEGMGAAADFTQPRGSVAESIHPRTS